MLSKRDRPVAGWLRSVCPPCPCMSKVTRPSVMSAGKEAAPGWRASLSTAVSSGPKLVPSSAGRTHMAIRQSLATCHAACPGASGWSSSRLMLPSSPAVPLSLLPLLRREVQVQRHEKLLLLLWRCVRRRKEALC